MIAKKLLGPEECQKWCQETKECEMFVYATESFHVESKKKYCYLKHNMADKLTTLKGLLAGPKYCQIYDQGKYFSLI